MRFADFSVGMVLAGGPRTVTHEEIVEFATRYDPQWFHVDPARAARGRWQGLIASGWMSCAIAMQMAVAAVLRDSESIGSPGVEQLKWLNPLRPGDEVSLQMQVLESRTSRSGKVGILRWRWLLTTQRNDVILDLVVTSLFEVSRR